MGRVYRAFDNRLERWVAIKVLQPREGEGQDAVAMALREARAAAAIAHPNATSIYDADERDGLAYIVMELVRGTSLRAIILDPSIRPLATRVRWLIDAAGALNAAHRVGVVHRDIKPENVMVREDGIIKVLDFGIARRIERLDPERPSYSQMYEAAQSGVSYLAGTPAYMSPEQVRGDDLDARADQFGWGVLAYELLTGRLPWTVSENFMGYVRSVLTEEPAPPSRHTTDMPAEIDRIVLRALSKDRANRFESMSSAAQGLMPFARPSIAMVVEPILHHAMDISPAARTIPHEAAHVAWTTQNGVEEAAEELPEKDATQYPASSPTRVSGAKEMAEAIASAQNEGSAAAREEPAQGEPAPAVSRPASEPPKREPHPSAPPPASPIPHARRSAPRAGRWTPSIPPDRGSDPGLDLPKPSVPPSSAVSPSSVRPRARTPQTPSFREPSFISPVDVAAHLAALTEAATCKGLFFNGLLDLAAPVAPKREVMRAVGLEEKRYVPFFDYPMRDLVQLTVAVSKLVHPGVPLGEALRRLGHSAFDTVYATHVGRAIFASIDLDHIILRGPKAYKLLLSFGEVTAEAISRKTYRMRIRNMPVFLETYQVGVLEGVMRKCKKSGSMRIALQDISNAVLLLEVS